MKYMVMECHPGYAVVLDEEGKFLKVANRHYEPGQTVTDIIEMREPKAKVPARYKWIGSIAAMAACMALIVSAVFQFILSPYGSVYMTINPEVRIDVNRNDTVVDLDGINEDGEDLIEGYDYKRKHLDLVMDELVDRAIEMGFLHEGDKITLTLDARDGKWVVKKSESIDTHLNEHLTDKLTVTIAVTNRGEGGQSADIPIPSDTETAETEQSKPDTQSASPETETTKPAETSKDTQSVVNTDTDYGPNNDGVTDYNDTDYGPNNDGVTDYTTTAPVTSKAGATDYTEKPDDGRSDYEDIDDDNDDDDNDDDDNDDDDGNSNYGDDD